MICQQYFSTNFKLQRHVKSDHCDTATAASIKAEPSPAEPDIDKKFKCQICREEFSWSDSLIKEHLVQKHCLTKDFYFTLYDKKSGKKSEEKLKGKKSDDKRKETTDDKFSCKECKFSSSRKMALTGHTKKYHEPGEEVTCCKVKLVTKWEVFVHLMESHKDKNKEMF